MRTEYGDFGGKEVVIRLLPNGIEINGVAVTVDPAAPVLTGTLQLANGVQILSGSGAPDDSVQATLSRNPAGDDNALTFTAVAYGEVGNAITIAYVDPSDNDIELSVDVVDSAIVVTLATDSGGTITSTAADILAAIEASEAASALVTVTINTADTGTNDDGSGVVTALAAAPMTGGVDGTGQGAAGTGSLYIDTDDGTHYRNTGTADALVWE